MSPGITDFLVVGAGPGGTKTSGAREHGTKTLSEGEFLELIAGSIRRDPPTEASPQKLQERTGILRSGAPNFYCVKLTGSNKLHTIFTRLALQRLPYGVIRL